MCFCGQIYKFMVIKGNKKSNIKNTFGIPVSESLETLSKKIHKWVIYRSLIQLLCNSYWNDVLCTRTRTRV